MKKVVSKAIINYDDAVRCPVQNEEKRAAIFKLINLMSEKYNDPRNDFTS